MTNLNQYFTPAWAAELLVRRHFPALSDGDVVVDPACGDGRFLMAIPEHVPAYGVDIDAAAAARAGENSGRQILVGDFPVIDLPTPPTVAIGNPPFVLSLVDQFLARLHAIMEYGGLVGFILPAYYFQTAGHTVKLARQWSISQEMIPRNLFPGGLTKPLVFAMFTKEKKTCLSGFFLYAETAALDGLRKEIRAMFVGNGSRANVWRETVHAALVICGGRATLQQLYQCIENNRPTDNRWWREKIRQVAAQFYERIDEGEYALKEAA